MKTLGLCTLFFLLLFCPPVSAMEQSWVRVTGYASLHSTSQILDLDRAWNEAVRNGVREALERHYPVFVEASSLLENAIVTWDRVITTVSGVVLDIRVVDLTRTHDLLTVTLDVLLPTHELDSSLTFPLERISYFGNPVLLSLSPPREMKRYTLEGTLFDVVLRETDEVLVATSVGLVLLDALHLNPTVIQRHNPILMSLLRPSQYLTYNSRGTLTKYSMTTQRFLFRTNHLSIQKDWEKQLGPLTLIRGVQLGEYFLLQYPSNDLQVLDWDGNIKGGYRLDSSIRSAWVGPTSFIYTTGNQWELRDAHSGYRSALGFVEAPLTPPVQSGRDLYFLENAKDGVMLSKWSLDGQLWWRNRVGDIAKALSAHFIAEEGKLISVANTPSGTSVVTRHHEVTGTVLWQRVLPSSVTTALKIVDKVLYVLQNGKLTAFDVYQGIHLWERGFPGDLLDVLLLLGSPDRFLVFSREGNVFLLEPTVY